MNYILSPSMLSCDFGKAGEQIQQLDQAGAGYIHIDVMDGAFVPSISFGLPVIKSWRKYTERMFDVHLMIEDPDRYITAFAEAGADILTVHAETCKHLDRTISAIHEEGLKCGVAINPATPLSAVEYILDKADMILLMTVNPGFGGQKYIPYCTDKIRTLRTMLSQRGLDTDIEIDGGVTKENVRELISAGANIIVAGSAVFKDDIQANVKYFLDVMEEF